MANTIKRIITLKILLSNRIIHINQDRSREFIFFLIYISATVLRGGMVPALVDGF